MQEFLPFTFHNFCNRDAGPLADYFCNLFFGNFIPQKAGLLCFFCQFFFFFKLCFQLWQFAIFELGCLIKVIFPFSTLDLSAYLFDLFTQLLNLGDSGLFVVPLCFAICEFFPLVPDRRITARSSLSLSVLSPSRMHFS